MNKKEFNYVSPTATVKEMQTEGVLCMSMIGKLSFSQTEEWKEVDFTDQW